MDKTLAMKNALRDILTKERSVIMDESRVNNCCGKKDSSKRHRKLNSYCLAH